MLNFINWLSKHKAVNLILLGIYYLLAVLSKLLPYST